jgi:N-acetylated-alpha-linked acidic dipeptidase
MIDHHNSALQWKNFISEESMRKVVLACSIFILLPFFASAVSKDAMLGFEESHAADQRKIETQFDSYLKAENLREWMKRLSARPHHVGSPYDKENAEFLASLFQSWGYDTQIEQFKVLFPTPKTRVLEMLAPEPYKAGLAEPTVEGDSTSSQHDEQLPTYNAYSTDGDVTGELVYVNYGVPKDYEELKLRGIDVKGKIVIARYYGAWRGVKPKVAAEHGAIGCIIYTDPSGDGYRYGDAYPKGGWRSEDSVQRGSVMDFTEHDGDPLTPFIGATENAKRIRREDSDSITKIPVLPISYKDALPLLRALEGPVVPQSWRGDLPIAYHFGPGPAKVHLKLEFNWNLSPIYDVIAKMKGTAYPDQWIIRGNHHDAWVNGATDPISGLVALLEEARAVSELAKAGIKPKRTLVYAAWDGEEPGLLGSTEWVEQHQDELQQKAVAYINSDSNTRGFFKAGGSQTLEKLVNQVTRDVQDPYKKVSVQQRDRASMMMDGSPDEKKEAQDREDLRLPALGSGSDYTPFLQFDGIASLDISFGGEEEYGQYHSIYDSFDHYLRFGDPDFQYGVALAKVGGRLVLRLANADVLPFEFTNFSDDLDSYVTELKKLADDMREETKNKNAMIDQRLYEAYFDPTKKFVAPEKQDPVPFLNFAPLENAAANLRRAADDYRKQYESAARDGKISAEKAQNLNAILMLTERALTRKEGLPGRPWFRHQLYAPGVYTGYAAKALPSIREAMENRTWDKAEQQIKVVSETLDRFTDEVKKAEKQIQ